MNQYKICNRQFARDIILKMIQKKTKYLFEMENVVSARLTMCWRQWYLRDLHNESADSFDVAPESAEDFRNDLKWKFDEDFFDRYGVSILFYAIISNHVSIVRELLKSLIDEEMITEKERRDRLVSAIPKSGFINFGMTGEMNSLHIAMYIGNVHIIRLLLEQNIDTALTDISGNHALLFAYVRCSRF